jgi:exodeoxyribonuclease VII large subunit
MQPEQELVFSVSDFVGLLNQTLEYAYPSVTIVGELANFRVSKNRWVYFDLKDDYSSVKFFGTVYQLPGPLEDGLMLQVRGTPRLHNQFGFSVNVQNIQPVGEGSLKKAAALLEAKLAAEGLFDDSRKRALPYPPKTIGLITSGESAAYHDFIKVIGARWGGLDIQLADVQVQGEPAPRQIVAAIEHFNTHAEPVDVLVVTRGGGSAEDLAAFSTEQVTRAIAGSRIPTLVAIGHEVDVSLAELAADRRASTPSNAAEMLVPDKKHELAVLRETQKTFLHILNQNVTSAQSGLTDAAKMLHISVEQLLVRSVQSLTNRTNLLEAFSPNAALKRGYAVIRTGEGTVLRSGKGVAVGDMLAIELSDATITTEVKENRLK